MTYLACPSASPLGYGSPSTPDAAEWCHLGGFFIDSFNPVLNPTGGGLNGRGRRGRVRQVSGLVRLRARHLAVARDPERDGGEVKESADRQKLEREADQ